MNLDKFSHTQQFVVSAHSIILGHSVSTITLFLSILINCFSVMSVSNINVDLLYLSLVNLILLGVFIASLYSFVIIPFVLFLYIFIFIPLQLYFLLSYHNLFCYILNLLSFYFSLKFSQSHIYRPYKFLIRMKYYVL